MKPVYKTIYDISLINTWHDYYSNFTFIVLFLIIGSLLLLLSMNTNIRTYMQKWIRPHWFPVRLFLILVITFALAWNMTVYSSFRQDMNILKDSLISGYKVTIEGEVTEFSKIHKHGDSYVVSFKVNDVPFKFEENPFLAGYHDINGPIKEGLMVRIHCYPKAGYLFKTILKLEIAE